MTRRFGIDTSALVRLLTKHPEAGFEYCVSKLHHLLDEGGEIFESNQVIGETYVAVQHHYGVSKADARASLRDALRSGLVAPLNGRPVIAAIKPQVAGRTLGHGPPEQGSAEGVVRSRARHALHEALRGE